MPQGGGQPPSGGGRRRPAWPAAAFVLLVRGRRAVVTEHVFWIVSRAAGIVALLASSCSVALGLLMAARLLRGRDLRTWHEALGLGTMAAMVVHAGALLFDSYVSPSVFDMLVPFVGSYQPLWTSLGIVCGWATLVLGLSYYVRARIGVARWRGCTAGRRSCGCSRSSTRSARAPTPVRSGSWSRSASSRSPPPSCSPVRHLVTT